MSLDFYRLAQCEKGIIFLPASLQQNRSSNGSICLSVRPSATLLGCLVCVICNSKSFHSVHLLFFAQFTNIFSFLRGV